jgi:hypothetical protein
VHREGHSPLVTLIVVAAVAVTSAQAPRLEPVDQGPQKPDFMEFRTELRRAIGRRDVAGLLRAVHPNIKSSFGGDDGIDAFKQHWRLDRADSKLWRELGAVLALGGTFVDPDQFAAPYVYSKWPETSDPFDNVALVGSNVRLRGASSASGRVLTTMSYAILRRKEPGSRSEAWTAIVLPDGRRGYVASHLVRSPIDYRAFFARSDGRWLMTLFVAGD